MSRNLEQEILNPQITWWPMVAGGVCTRCVATWWTVATPPHHVLTIHPTAQHGMYQHTVPQRCGQQRQHPTQVSPGLHLFVSGSQFTMQWPGVHHIYQSNMHMGAVCRRESEVHPSLPLSLLLISHFDHPRCTHTNNTWKASGTTATTTTAATTTTTSTTNHNCPPQPQLPLPPQPHHCRGHHPPPPPTTEAPTTTTATPRTKGTAEEDIRLRSNFHPLWANNNLTKLFLNKEGSLGALLYRHRYNVVDTLSTNNNFFLWQFGAMCPFFWQ